MKQLFARRAIAGSAFALVAAAGMATAQTQQWEVTFNVTDGPLAPTTFTGVISYEQADLDANFVDGVLLAEFNQFTFTATVPGGVVLDLDDDAFARIFFQGDTLVGLDYLGDNGVQAINTFDSPISTNNFFQVFVDPDFIPDGSGTFSFTRLTAPTRDTVGYNSTNASIDDTDILSTPTTVDTVEDTNFNTDGMGNPSVAVSVDFDDGPGSVNPRQVLIRYNDIIGNGANQIPLGSTILGAAFRVEIISTGSGFSVHRLLEDWDVNAVTWNNFGTSPNDGILADDIEAVAIPEFMIGPVGGNQLLADLTESVQAWADGADNFGFALLPFVGGTDGVDFWTSEAPENVELFFFPPLLTVTLTDGTILTFQENRDGYTGTADTTLRQVNPDTNFGFLNTTSIDRNDGGFMSQYLLRYDGIFGTGAGQINNQIDVGIESATITVNVTSEGLNVSVNELVVPFDETRATWNSFGNGIDVDTVAPFQANNPAEVNTTPVTVVNTDNTTGMMINFDVTSSLQAWFSNPNANLGWAFIPESTDGFDFDAEGTLMPPVGPQLFVSFIAPEFPGCNPADLAEAFGTLDINDILVFAAAFNAMDAAADYFPEGGDGTFDINDILTFAGFFNAGCP